MCGGMAFGPPRIPHHKARRPDGNAHAGPGGRSPTITEGTPLRRQHMDHPHQPPTGRGVRLALAPEAAAGTIDPVCGMTVDPGTAPASVTHEGRTYYFCNPSCA